MRVGFHAFLRHGAGRGSGNVSNGSNGNGNSGNGSNGNGNGNSGNGSNGSNSSGSTGNCNGSNDNGSNGHGSGAAHDNGGSMINSNVFSYVNVLDKAADASWLRNQAISNNIANVDTPGYKRQDVAFEDELTRMLNKVEYDTMDARVYNMQLSKIEPRVYTDAFDYSYRLDGNNVDIDSENVYLAENQVKYNGLISCMQNEFANLRTAMGSS